MKSIHRVRSARAEKHQSLGLMLSEEIVLSPGRAEEAVRDIARNGYGIVRTMLRNTNMNHRDARVIDAVARIVRVAHELGLRVVLDCEPHSDPLGRDIGSLYPEAMGTRCVRVEGSLVNGQFVLRCPSPGAQAGIGEPATIQAAYLRLEDGTVQRLPDFICQQSVEIEVYDNGYITQDDQYVEGRPRRDRVHVRMIGQLPGHTSGKLIVYAGFRDRRKVDFWSADCTCYYQQILESYRAIPLDGVGWDEPAQGGNWGFYLAGTAFSAAFEKLNGYSLWDRFYLMDEPVVTADAVRLRLDYYRTLNEGVFQAQRQFIATAREIFGDDLLLGTHHTWQGEGGINDPRAGAVDYFRLNQNMDAGYTDCCWWDPFSVAYSYTLGSSLGRLSPTGAAEINTWHFKPTNALVEYNARLMTLMNVTWFNIWYGEMTDTCLYPSHYTWPATVREMRRHRAAQQRIGAARPVVEIAILHGWETVAGINRPEIAGAHKTFCLNSAELLSSRNIPFDWIDSELLAQGHIDGSRFVTALGTYSVLVLPYASILPRAAWRKCQEFAKAGGKLLFVGLPVEMDTEGTLLRDDFAHLLAMPVLELPAYLGGLNARFRLPAMRPEKLDVSYPLKGEPSRLIFSAENEPHGIQNSAGNIVYLTDLDPRGRFLKIIQSWIEPEVICYSDSMLWRLYRDGSRNLLVLVARKEMKLSGVVRLGDHEFEFSGGTVALIEQTPLSCRVHGEDLTFKQRENSVLAEETLIPDNASRIGPIPQTEYATSRSL